MMILINANKLREKDNNYVKCISCCRANFYNLRIILHILEIVLWFQTNNFVYNYIQLYWIIYIFSHNVKYYQQFNSLYLNITKIIFSATQIFSHHWTFFNSLDNMHT